MTAPPSVLYIYLFVTYVLTMTVFIWAKRPTVAKNEQMTTELALPKRSIKNLHYPYISTRTTPTQHISEKLSNYSMGVIKSVSAAKLDRAEDYHVERFNADLSLNRYKVTS